MLQARIAEAEDCIDGLNAKVATTEKLRNRYQIDLEDLQVEFEKVTAQIAVAEKKLKTFDKVRTGPDSRALERKSDFLSTLMRLSDFTQSLHAMTYRTNLERLKLEAQKKEIMNAVEYL